MPELPEVETMRRGILGIVGQRIENVFRCRCRQKPIGLQPGIGHFRRRVKLRAVCDVVRKGKRVVLRIETGDAIVVEPRMTGLLLLADPPSRTHLRLRIRFSQHDTELLYWDRRGLGSVRLFSAQELEQELGPAKLGPDALIMTAELYQQRLAASCRAIKVALLDQKAVAGIGNLYASEILHVAGIHPQRLCNRMTCRQWESLAAATRQVLEEAIRYEGSTLSDGTYRNALNKAGNYQNQHRVYAKAKHLCPRCRRRQIVRIVQAQRSTFFCPGCQRKAGIRSNSANAEKTGALAR